MIPAARINTAISHPHASFYIGRGENPNAHKAPGSVKSINFVTPMVLAEAIPDLTGNFSRPQTGEETIQALSNDIVKNEKIESLRVQIRDAARSGDPKLAALLADPIVGQVVNTKGSSLVKAAYQFLIANSDEAKLEAFAQIKKALGPSAAQDRKIFELGSLATSLKKAIPECSNGSKAPQRLIQRLLKITNRDAMYQQLVGKEFTHPSIEPGASLPLSSALEAV